MLKSLYLRNKLVLFAGINIILFVLGFPYPFIYTIALIYTVLFVSILIVDILLVYSVKKGIEASRDVKDKLSNGDFNPITIRIKSEYTFGLGAYIIDELPHQFQDRNNAFRMPIAPKDEETFVYYIRPFERGIYEFGHLNIYVNTRLGLVAKRYKLLQPKTISVYPSYMQLKEYEFMAISNRLQEFGIKKIRKIGQSREFDQIREYVPGDDIRTINWRATARKDGLMVNQYQDEKSQNVYCLIDKGRSMKMPFNQLSLLDYAINSSLVCSNIAVNKDDKAGLVTFSNEVETFIKASRQPTQMRLIQDSLFKQNTAFKESDYSKLYKNLKWNLHQRSLLLLFTNFETLLSLKRQMKYLKQISKHHLLVVVFFENTELREFTQTEPQKTLDIYEQILAEKIGFEKKLIIKELKMQGIHSVYTPPENLTVNVINKYLELKSRNLI